MPALNDRAFQAFARMFPTQKVGHNAVGAVWRIVFYALQPSQPFVMATPYYKLWAWPKKGTLTRTVIRRGHWEATLTRLCLPWLKPGGLMVDAGANFGHFGLVAAGIVGPTGRVFAFEPHGPTFALLQSNVTLNGFDWMTPVRAALGDTAGEVILTTDAANAGGHSLNATNVARAAGETVVPQFTLDAYLADHAPGRRVDVMKIDVQGYEAHLIAGALGTIARDRPMVLCEVTPDMLQKASRTVDEVLKPFRDLGYEASMIWDSMDKVEKTSFEDVAAYCDGLGHHIDLLLTPPGKDA